MRQTINIIICRRRLTGDDSATMKQLKYLSHLCQSKDIILPFETLQIAKKHLKKYEVRKAIQHLIAGNTIEFIFPINNE